MGCVSSKPKVRRDCKAPVRRSKSMHVHHPPQKTGETYHLEALTSSPLGSFRLDPSIQNQIVEEKFTTAPPSSQNQSFTDDKATFGSGEIVPKKSVKEEFAIGIIEAKTWSTMINEKIPQTAPKTPILTPPGEPETINAWEMMEGLEDISPLRPNHGRSFSFNVFSNSNFPPNNDQTSPRAKESIGSSPKPAWSDLAGSDLSSNLNSNDTSIVSEFDPEVIATFRKSLEDLPPANLFHLKAIEYAKQTDVKDSKNVVKAMEDAKRTDEKDGKNVVKPIEDAKLTDEKNAKIVVKPIEDAKLTDEKDGKIVFRPSEDAKLTDEKDGMIVVTPIEDAKQTDVKGGKIIVKPIEGAKQTDVKDGKIIIRPIEDAKQTDEKDCNNVVKRGAGKLIVYFTSLRGVRKTYEDCCHVRVILKGLRVKVDERDVSMDLGFKEELKELLGEGFGKMGLPRVFLGTKCVGGAEEIRRLNEEGKLKKFVEKCELIDGEGEGGNVCEACGDIRFVPCETCSGSRKIYYDDDGGDDDDDDDNDERDENEHEYGFRRCPNCNENGLTRCPICCD